MAQLSRGRRLMGEINVVPYIDVMLVLLIIFMVTAPLLAQGIKVDLPKAGAEPLPPEAQEPLVLSIDKGGKLYLNVGGSPNAILTRSGTRTGGPRIRRVRILPFSEHFEKPGILAQAKVGHYALGKRSGLQQAILCLIEFHIDRLALGFDTFDLDNSIIFPLNLQSRGCRIERRHQKGHDQTQKGANRNRAKNEPFPPLDHAQVAPHDRQGLAPVLLRLGALHMRESRRIVDRHASESKVVHLGPEN